MVQIILEMFISEQKAEAVLAHPLIELIFLVLLIMFVVATIVHLMCYRKLSKIRHYLTTTNRLDIAPLDDFKRQYDDKRQTETISVETFVQERFSSWRVFHVPVISLIKIVQMTVSVFILIGVLGTFIGLTMALSSIEGDGNRLVEHVTTVLAGVDIAFYTSIAGMGMSLIMTVLTKVFNTELVLTDIMLKFESHLEENEQKGINQLIDVSEAINASILDLQATNRASLQNIEHAFTGFQEYTDGLEQAAEDLASFNDGLADNLSMFQALFEQMKVVTDGFSEGTAKLNSNFKSLFNYFKKMEAKQERMVQAFEQTYEKIADVSQTQIDTLDQFTDAVTELKAFTSSLLEQQASLNDAFTRIHDKSDELVKNMELQNKAFKETFGEHLDAELAGIKTYLGEISQDFDTFGHSIEKLPEALEVINKTQAEYKHLLADRFEDLKAFNRTFNVHLQTHHEEAQQFDQQIRKAAETFAQMGRENQQLIKDINTTVLHINETFQQWQKQIESRVESIQQTFSNNVSSFETMLGEKLDRLARSITASVEKTNEGLQREFQNLHRIMEDIQTSQARYTQQMVEDLGREVQAWTRQLSTLRQRPEWRQDEPT
ncbi:MAG TPA: MotA/TolQ/ExbB proton channel family protein [Bacillota bacterium]|nr:MotA/TolQ/ExbB proton channel family protein [Bacillota bacterium]